MGVLRFFDGRTRCLELEESRVVGIVLFRIVRVFGIVYKGVFFNGFRDFCGDDFCFGKDLWGIALVFFGFGFLLDKRF